MNRRAFLGGLGALLAPGALRRGVGFLSSRQHTDGGWRSETYGLLRSGQSLTPLIANALLDAGVPVRDSRVVRAVRFAEGTAGADGAVGMSGYDYPCYATALSLRLFVRTGHPLAPRLEGWLRSQQMSPANGWRPEDLAFGAWGIGGVPRTAPDSGHIDISMTRHVLEALAEAGVPPSDAAMRNALVFLSRCRNPDGGSFFSTVETGANKAGEAPTGFHSYATATADALIGQVAVCGPAAHTALAWLQANDHAVLPAGFHSPARRRYAEGLRFYYVDAAVRAFRAAGVRRPVPYAAALAACQSPDGGWRNAEPLVKEDDPLIATAFAVSALALG